MASSHILIQTETDGVESVPGSVLNVNAGCAW